MQDAVRIAILGDFSARAARGLAETGAALAARRPIAFDIDTAEAVIAGFATTLALPMGPDGAGVVLHLRGLDSLHPDALWHEVAAFADLAALRQRLAAPATSAAAVAEMKGWGDALATPGPAADPGPRAGAPAAGFARLIGDGRPRGPAPAADLIARIVAPYVVAAPHPEAAAFGALVEAAAAGLMRQILHHPDVRSVEALWRALDLIARRVQTGAALRIVLYDVSEGELAADLAAAGDLAASGLHGLLAAAREAGGLAAVFGLYRFGQTPPDAELLARLAQLAAHHRAPFVTALADEAVAAPPAAPESPAARAWAALRALPEAAWLGLAAPGFLLRRPYGRGSDPIDAVAFEEFTLAEGLSGLLWANPAVAVAVLLAQAQTDAAGGGGGGPVAPGAVTTLPDMPFHVVTDRHGDRVALPCTARDLGMAGAEAAAARGLMPLVSVRGRDELRLARFGALSGGPLRGPWSHAEDAPGPTSQAGGAPGPSSQAGGAPGPSSRAGGAPGPTLRAGGAAPRLPALSVILHAGGTEDERAAALRARAEGRSAPAAAAPAAAAPAPPDLADPDAIDPALAALLEGR